MEKASQVQLLIFLQPFDAQHPPGGSVLGLLGPPKHYWSRSQKGAWIPAKDKGYRPSSVVKHVVK